MTLSIEEANLHAIGTVFPFFLVIGNKGLEKPQKGWHYIPQRAPLRKKINLFQYY